MKNRCLATLSCALFLLGNGIVSFPTAAVAGSPLSFKPPSRNRPKVTIGGASRSTCIKDEKVFKALLPENQFGLTTTDRPSIMVYVPKNEGKKLDVTLTQIGQRKPLLSKSFAVPANAGLVRLNLHEPTLPKLAAGKQYVWSVRLMCERPDAIDRTQTETYEAAFVQGIIESIPVDAAVKQAIATASAKQLPRIYAEAGIWQDALISLHELRRTQPHDAELNADWESLLKSAGLSDFAQAPIAECCKMQP
jgi:Domain of Unknown Function (DUF928)